MQYTLYWLIIGALLAFGFAVSTRWFGTHKIVLKWYEWLIGILGLAFLLLAVQAFLGTYFVEKFTTAAWMSLMALGIPGIVLLVIAWNLAVRRKTSVV